jgi:hypothetical protein
MNLTNGNVVVFNPAKQEFHLLLKQSKLLKTKSAIMVQMYANKKLQKLSYFPQIKVVHTSKVFHGQLYVPLMNWLLMIGTVLVAVIYNNVCHIKSRHLGKADKISRQPPLEMLMGMAITAPRSICTDRVIQSVRDVRYVFRYVYGLTCGHVCLAHPTVLGVLPMAYHSLSGWCILIVGFEQGPCRRLVHANPCYIAGLLFYPVAIR